MPPYFSNPPDSFYEVLPGTNLSLVCVAYGLPMPYVSWRKQMQSFTNERTSPSIGRDVLQLINIQESANYTCVAHSQLGSVDTSTSVIVLAVPPPPTNIKITEVPSSSAYVASYTISWSYDTDGDEVVSFIIRYKPRDLDEFSEISGIRTYFYTVGSLQPYTVYEFYVLAVNSFGPGRPSSPAFVTTGENGVLIFEF